MTRKHFIALANALAMSKPTGVGVQCDAELRQWGRDVEAVADACNSMNYRFCYSTFYSACSYDPEMTRGC